MDCSKVFSRETPWSNQIITKRPSYQTTEHMPLSLQWQVYHLYPINSRSKWVRITAKHSLGYILSYIDPSLVSFWEDCWHIDNIRSSWEICLSPFFIRWNWLLWDHTDLRLCFPWCTTNRGKRVLEYIKTMLWKTVPTTSSANSINISCISRRS